MQYFCLSTSITERINSSAASLLSDCVVCVASMMYDQVLSAHTPHRFIQLSMCHKFIFGSSSQGNGDFNCCPDQCTTKRGRIDFSYKCQLIGCGRRQFHEMSEHRALNEKHVRNCKRRCVRCRIRRMHEYSKQNLPVPWMLLRAQRTHRSTLPTDAFEWI